MPRLRRRLDELLREAAVASTSRAGTTAARPARQRRARPGETLESVERRHDRPGARRRRGRWRARLRGRPGAGTPSAPRAAGSATSVPSTVAAVETSPTSTSTRGRSCQRANAAAVRRAACARRPRRPRSSRKAPGSRRARAACSKSSTLTARAGHARRILQRLVVERDRAALSPDQADGDRRPEVAQVLAEHDRCRGGRDRSERRAPRRSPSARRARGRRGAGRIARARRPRAGSPRRRPRHPRPLPRPRRVPSRASRRRLAASSIVFGAREHRVVAPASIFAPRASSSISSASCVDAESIISR